MEKPKFRPPMTNEALSGLSEQLAKEKAQYEVLKQNFEGLRTQREKEFMKELDGLLTDEERDIVEVGGNAGQTYAILKAHEKTFIDDVIADEAAVLEELENELYNNEGKLEVLKIESEFATANPDVDFEGLVSFITNGMNNNELNELHKEADGDQSKFMTLASAKFGGGTKTKENGDELPTDLSGVAGATGNVDDGDGMSDEDDSFAKQAGLYR